jgi:hypothetical protein
MQVSATDPQLFNDPFEVRPFFDQECHDYFAKTHEAFYEKAIGIKHSLIAGRSMAGIPTEDAAGFGENLTKRFREALGGKFRVLCLSQTCSNPLMWGHYTNIHQGIAIGIDTDCQHFQKGLKSDGYQVEYVRDRSRTKLPLAFFQSPSVETYDPYGNLANKPDEQIESSGGLLIPFREYRRQVDQSMMTALTTKAEDWKYEREIRFIYELPRHADQLVVHDNRHFAAVPREALAEIIVGFRASSTFVAEIVRLYRTGAIGRPKLFFSQCHPYFYQVQAHEVDDKYLLSHFNVALPST